MTTGWISTFPVCYELLTLSERKTKKKKTWGALLAVPMSRTLSSITQQLKYILFTIWKVSEQDFKLRFRNIFIKTDWYYVIDFTTVSWTQTLRGQRHNAYENVNMNTAAGVNEQNVCKIHITKTVCQVKHAVAPEFEVP